MIESVKEFKPTILFLLKFLGIYIVGNLLYGWYVNASLPQPDSATYWVSVQSAWLINVFGQNAKAIEYPSESMMYLQLRESSILTVYEGCNGLNVAIVFLAFLFAFGPYTKTMVWFIPLGLFIIHMANLLRIVGLFFVSLFRPDYLYITHKYLFTAFIYLFVFLLWIWWVMKLAKPMVEREEYVA